ncbi:MAG TPA: putative peptidoglycan glycosyltransferase FtsW [Armatimonadota bacterium]|nr:putative peptidoglycan glycosyltransferase FtsW [Armatimonadota bacterium]
MRRLPAFDMPLFICFLILVGLGITYVYTSSYPKALPDSGEGGVILAFTFAGKQIFFALLGLLAMFGCMYTSINLFRRFARIIYYGIGFLLVLVLMVGAAKHGNRAWIDVGLFQFQPSEFEKVAIIIALSAYLAEHPWCVRTWKGLLTGPYLIIGIPLVLIALQGDLGTATVTALASIVIMAVAGTKFRFWGVPMLIFLCLAAIAVLTSHRVERIEAWRHPFNESIQESYQPRNSLIAVGSGALFGRGFCMSRQKWFYLPGSHNDYIFAIIAEELGFFGLLIFLFAPYLFMSFRGFTVAHRAPDEFSALMAAGCTVMLTTQALINMCVVTNIIPCMGINLPFISYGGTSLIASMIMAGLLLNVSGQRLKQQHRHTTRFEAMPTA